MNHLLREVLPALDLDEDFAADRLAVAGGNGLPSRLPVNTLACGAVAAAGLAGLAAVGGDRVLVDPLAVSVAFRSDSSLSVDGRSRESFAPLSGFFRAADGWVRTHANYPHHRERLLHALQLPADATREGLGAAVGELAAQDVEDRVTRGGGVAVRVRDHREWFAGQQAQAVQAHPVLSVDSVAPAATVPLSRRPRVLDLTRVIAGPVATRTLAFLGCEVLRVDSPTLPELEPQHVDTGSGKRSTLLDLHRAQDRDRLHGLLERADVLVTGYRPGALPAFGLGSEVLAARHPSLVVASLSAWTPDGPWGARRGFDSIVQAATGIALIESGDGERPGVLPAQALDHATGYLLAAGVMAALRRRAEVGGTWRVQAHLARTAHWLLRTDALDAPAHPVGDPSPWLTTADTDYGRVVQARPAFRIGDGPVQFAWPARRWGSDRPEWAQS
ncbi:CoA transferase [Knoellia sp. 3-2P3]|uniref:CoA transferase n=1 Tax=unclassified Knoellia TaxID=2618719 RepID=UPI0023DAE726|nr:CoA transferase [Knoellia sp. 3-2P3]MDF2092938.1 CoA transferase [Knoellia sp. 3-2P3]